MLEEDYLRRMPDPIFFDSPKAFGKWLAKNHDKATELWVGYHKVHTGKPSLTWPQSVDEALCFGWIDGVRRSVDDESYTIRFSPRKPTSIWSAVNIKRATELIAEGRMSNAGHAAFARRDEKRSAIYAYEQQHAALEGEALEAMKADCGAWTFYQSQAPWYRRTTAHWVNSAKKPETRARRLATLMECSRKGERLPQLVALAGKSKKAKRPSGG
jgi:uncharacterized protein YdeI (YjbR/CyaY-like superfamily)